MGHHHGHSHDHHHGHSHTGNKKALLSSFILIAVFMIVEVVGGLFTNSLALLSDAGHMLSDAASLGLSFFALKLGEREVSQDKTFGYKRFEIIAAGLNGITLVVVSIYIFYEAFQRLFAPPEVQSQGMLVISVIGFIVNIIAAWMLMKGDKDDNLNIRSAFLHVLGDLLGSVGAIVAALFIMYFGWGIADPIASIIVGILIIISGWRVVKESFHVLMEGAPEQIDIKQVKEALCGLPMVKEVHDLHVWTITSGYPVLSCHITILDNAVHDEILSQSQRILHDQFDIEHSTIQVEKVTNGCPSPHGTCN
ncbi:cation diffusion facilitator family transporter [Neobacillus sp. PS3-40]|uniref:cation diffusion facilitator family transporter n=1 Tax=Neobacillus sp. PS3-40 TaxID=3070679 RepID=UPI0027DED3C6|nr:cation diffusion facilitator family transporter [Neobacillus sp. PS3-40]WML46019.1 cation diffusion facilitator family transporter [Neobacillus sp. PS3-40]